MEHILNLFRKPPAKVLAAIELEEAKRSLLTNLSAAEREACAKLFDDIYAKDADEYILAISCAKIIRARSNT